jgi:hypothetical protein
MKKLFTVLMAFCMCLSFGFAATSCKYLADDTSEDSTLMQSCTVTNEQWENAIKKESFQNVTFTQHIALFGETELLEDFTIKMTENEFFMKGTVTSSQNSQNNASGAIYYTEEEALKLKKIYTDSFNEAFMEKANFRYKEDENFYVRNTLEKTVLEDQTVLEEIYTTTKVRFNKNGKIILITISFEQKSGAKEINGNARFLFSNYETTTITNEEILSANNPSKDDTQSPIYPMPL